MPEEQAPQPSPSDQRRPGRRRRALLGLAGAAVLVVGLALAAFGLAGATLSTDPGALARYEVGAFGGTVEKAQAFGPGGRQIPVVVRSGQVEPKTPIAPGERVSVDLVVRRPGWLGWLIGSEDHQQLTFRAPVARVRSQWLTVHSTTPRVSFNQPVSQVAYGVAGDLRRQSFPQPRSSVSLDTSQAAGTVLVASAPRPWERLSSPQPVTWFPAGNSPSVAASPPPGATVSPATPLRLTFSRPVADVLGSARPTLSSNASGSWRQTDSHTLLFTPHGYGAGLATTLRAELPRQLEIIQADGSPQTGRDIGWTIPPGSTLRLQQLLAQAGYLPLEWKPAGAPVPRTASAELRAAIEPPAGRFTWRYPNSPAGLRAVWSAGKPNTITRGAVMALENEGEMEADGEAGSAVWGVLLRDAIAAKRKPEPGYSYVYVSESVPETVTLWHNGKKVLTTAANTGIPGAETALGTYPVFEHLSETTMSGTNPDGSHYSDPGIKWVSYFNGGDALHSFDRASFGTPQSLGCVEMPLEEAAKVWPYTPIGTLVTVAQ
ncbi:MAG TPA: L,D-transpeptidase [Solirubrobacterales bacterium]|nr:L,D-transpeptidase [Solirubrobacterales bacterium]